jgi:uncharacterized membrane protein YphA (DoxX/SURF4 family)
MNGKTRRIIGTVLIVVGGILLLGSGATKIAHVPQVVAQMSSNGFSGGKLTLVGILEVVCALLFLIPATRSGGFLLVSSFLGGAVATHFQHNQPVFAPSIVLALLWLGAWLRHPVILWKATGEEQPAADNRQFARWSSQL